MRSMKSKLGWRVVAMVVLVGGLMVTSYGPGVIPAAADPPSSNPGNPFRAILDKLDQILAAITGAAGQDNHTLRWDQNLPAATRFVVLAAFSNAAVLDKNTGLVWEQSPATPTMNWYAATDTCIKKTVGGQKAWRLPSIPELASLIDPSVSPPGPVLPPGHPFTNVQPHAYWSATSAADSPSGAWYVSTNDSFVGGSPKSVSFHAWCVRGGMNADQY